MAAVATASVEPPGKWKDEIKLRQVELENGIGLRVAETGEGNQQLVLMVHGFPESWFSWRHQLVALAAEGYHCVAPDMRGYGGSSAPFSPASYSVHDMAGDLLLLVQKLGKSECALVAHDWGAVLAWMLVVLHPAVFKVLANLSVPYAPWTPQPPMERWQKMFGDKFFYILYHNEVPESSLQKGAAETEYDANARELLYRLFSSPSVPRDPPETQDPLRSAGPWLHRHGRPHHLPAWLSAAEFDYFVAQFEATGFRGGVNYYRNFDTNWQFMAPYRLHKIAQPVLFLAGRADLVLPMFGGEEVALANMKEAIPHVESHLLDNCGHWTQQEYPEITNEKITQFLQKHFPSKKPDSSL